MKNGVKTMPAENKCYVVYMLKCGDGSLYTGYTNDLQGRLIKHTEGKGAKYTRGRGPFQVVYEKKFSDKSEAMRYEAQIKKLSRQDKLCLTQD